MHHALTAIGANHVIAGLPCQDAAASGDLNGIDLLIVADGAGSARHSELGSSMAIAAMVRTFQNVDTACLPGKAGAEQVLNVFLLGLAEFRKIIGEHAQTIGAQIEDFATTLAVVVCAWPWVTYVGIGDAFMVARDCDNRLFLLVPPDKPGSYRNETEFAIREIEPRLVIVEDDQINAVVLSTDGLEKFLEERIAVGLDGNPRPIHTRPSRTFAGLIAELETGTNPEVLGARLETSEFQQRKGDDIGVAVAWR